MQASAFGEFGETVRKGLIKPVPVMVSPIQDTSLNFHFAEISNRKNFWL